MRPRSPRGQDHLRVARVELAELVDDRVGGEALAQAPRQVGHVLAQEVHERARHVLGGGGGIGLAGEDGVEQHLRLVPVVGHQVLADPHDVPHHLPEVKEGFLLRSRDPAAPALEAQRDHVAEGEEHHGQLLLVDRGVVPQSLVPDGSAAPLLPEVVALLGRPGLCPSAPVARRGRPVGQLVGVLEHEADGRVQEAHLAGGQEAAAPQEPLAALLRLLRTRARGRVTPRRPRGRASPRVCARPVALGIDVLQDLEVELGRVVLEHLEPTHVQDVVREQSRLVDPLEDVLAVLELGRRVEGGDALLAQVAGGQGRASRGPPRRRASCRATAWRPRGASPRRATPGRARARSTAGRRASTRRASAAAPISRSGRGRSNP